MTETEEMIVRFVGGLGGSRYQEIFELLESGQLSPLGKSNTETLLFQCKGANGNVRDVLAFRLKPAPVISFPKSYWNPRAGYLGEIMGAFSYSERPPTSGAVSDSQYSAGQVTLSRQTHERVMSACRKVCESLV